jgi:hypothetical protein
MSNEDLNLTIGGDASGALRALDSVQDRARDFAQETVRELAKLTAEIFGLEKAFEGVKEGILKADEIRDLSNSLAVFTGSTKNAAEAMEYFEKQAANTRNTGEELAKVFRDVLPLATTRFGSHAQEVMKPVTVMLSQLATMGGKTADEMERGFQQLLAGRVSPGRNPLLAVLGIDKASAKDLGFDTVVEDMMKKTEGFSERFGQTWESTFHKAKETLLTEFAGGFNEASGDAQKSMAGLMAFVESPEVKGALHDLGKNIAEIAPVAIQAFEGAGGALRIFFGGIEAGAGVMVSAVASTLAKLTDMSAAFADHMPGWQKALIKYTSGIDIAGGGEAAASFGQYARAISDDGGHIADLGETNIRAGMEMISNAQNPLEIHLAKAHTEAAGLSKEMLAILKALGAINATSTKPGGALDSIDKLTMSPWKLKYMSQNSPGTLPFIEGVGGFGTDQGAIDSAYSDVSAQMAAAIWKGAQEEAARKFAQEALDRFRDGFSENAGNLFAGFIEGGGKGFARTAAAEFSRLIQPGAQDFAKTLMTLLGGGGVTVDAHGNIIPTDASDPQRAAQRAKYAQNALIIGESGISGYQAGTTQYKNSITQSALGGFVGGLTSGNLGVAVASAIVGAIGAAIGKAQTRADYQYGAPSIIDGQAHLFDTKNLTGDARLNYQRQIQGTYDQYRNSYMHTLFDLGMGGRRSAPSTDASSRIRPALGRELQAWLQGKLPSDVAGQFKGDDAHRLRKRRPGGSSSTRSGRSGRTSIPQRWRRCSTRWRRSSPAIRRRRRISAAADLGQATTDVHASFSDQLRNSDKDSSISVLISKTSSARTRSTRRSSSSTWRRAARSKSNRSGPTSSRSPSRRTSRSRTRRTTCN